MNKAQKTKKMLKTDPLANEINTIGVEITNVIDKVYTQNKCLNCMWCGQMILFSHNVVFYNNDYYHLKCTPNLYNSEIEEKMS